jgi:hypothetical protein
MGRAASEYVQAHFSRDGQMAALLEIYGDVIDEAHGARG